MHLPRLTTEPNLDQGSVIPPFFNPRQSSLPRGSLLVLLSLGAAVLLSNFPHNRATLALSIPAIFAVAGTAETIRCMKPRWSLYHAGVLLLIYMDIMALTIIVFLFLYPYTGWIASGR